MFLLDTNICIHLLNASYKSLYRRVFLEREPEDLALSAVTAAELEFGLQKSQAKAKNRARLDLLVREIQVMPFDTNAAAAYGRVRATLERRGMPIGPLDTLIAGHCLALGATLVSNNVGEFRRIPCLQVVDWTED